MKNVGTVNHLYFYVNGMLLMEYRYNAMGDTTDVLQYFYDANGKPHAMAYNGTVYLYVTNLQGDIVALLGLDGTISGYEYDPYGNVVASYGDIAAINPLRYRGYYYDNETGLYYLQSRYYDPVVGRFINADSYASTGQGIIGYNMYTYCKNDPVILHDSAGSRAEYPDLLISLSEEQVELVKINADIRNFDVNNTDPQVVYNSNFFSAYHGTLVLRISHDYLTSWAIGGIIFLNHNNDKREDRVYTLDHEYGHILQEQEFGKIKYVASVFLPSTVYNVLSRDNVWLSENYYNMPWEHDANRRTGVPWGNAFWADTIADFYFDVIWR